VTWTIGNVPPGATYTLLINTTVDANLSAPVTNTALLSALNVDGLDASATAQFIEQLPPTGETPLWATLLQVSGLLAIGIGLSWIARRVIRRRL
jgi:hypothetical protein